MLAGILIKHKYCYHSILYICIIYFILFYCAQFIKLNCCSKTMNTSTCLIIPSFRSILCDVLLCTNEANFSLLVSRNLTHIQPRFSVNFIENIIK